jgi:hypothetical protein
VGKTLSAADLLAGSNATYTIEIPAALLNPDSSQAEPGEVSLRPLTVRDVQRLSQAAKDEQILMSTLMVQQALVKPKLTVEQVAGMPAGVVQFLLGKVNQLSGLAMSDDELEKAVRAPLARACFILSREFGWTPSQCAELTVGQVLLYLEMLARGETPRNGHV